jgi:hypothetical protein
MTAYTAKEEILSKKLFLRDINEVSYLELNHIKTTAIKQGSRISWEVEATDETYRLLQLYSNKPSVTVLDYVSTVRRLRSEMYGLQKSRTSCEHE